MLSVYLDACKRLQVSAVSGVVQEINRRKCSMQPLPYHVMSGKTKAQKIHFVLAWINVEDTDGLSCASNQLLIVYASVSSTSCS